MMSLLLGYMCSCGDVVLEVVLGFMSEFGLSGTVF